MVWGPTHQECNGRAASARSRRARLSFRLTGRRTALAAGLWPKMTGPSEAERASGRLRDASELSAIGGTLIGSGAGNWTSISGRISASRSTTTTGCIRHSGGGVASAGSRDVGRLVLSTGSLVLRWTTTGAAARGRGLAGNVSVACSAGHVIRSSAFYELFEAPCDVWRRRRYVPLEEVVIDVRKNWRRIQADSA